MTMVAMAGQVLPRKGGMIQLLHSQILASSSFLIVKISSVAGYIHTELLDDFAWMNVKSLSLLITIVSEEKLISYVL